MPHELDAAVSALMRRIAAETIMPRFRTLAASEIMEKAPDDYVTVADQESEARLTEGLAALLPGSQVIGEEACAADPSLLDRLDDGARWIVDPLDGTANFASGRTPFAMMVALLADGETRAGWILDPVGGRLCHAALGGGAFVDGERISSRGTGAAKPVAALATRYLPDDLRADLDARADGTLTQADIPLCAGEQYPRVGLGENDICLFWRALPWDHAPGALWLTEAGGRIARFDGAPYRPASKDKGLIAAATPRLWDAAARILLG